MAMSKSVDYIEVLIQMIGSRPHLYDKSLESYRDNSLRRNAWAEISELIIDITCDEQFTAKELEKIWDNLKKDYYKQKDKNKEYIPSGSAAPDETNSLEYFRLMAFLENSPRFSSKTKSSQHRLVNDEKVDDVDDDDYRHENYGDDYRPADYGDDYRPADDNADYRPADDDADYRPEDDVDDLLREDDEDNSEDNPEDNGDDEDDDVNGDDENLRENEQRQEDAHLRRIEGENDFFMILKELWRRVLNENRGRCFYEIRLLIQEKRRQRQ